jgi:hypothetical protein
MKKIEVPKAVKGRGYVGTWGDPDNKLGWALPDYLGQTRPGKCFRTFANPGVRAYLCEITIKPVLDGKGRPITRKKK